MLSFLNMECISCGAEYTLSIEELNVMVLFKCFASASSAGDITCTSRGTYLSWMIG